MIEKEYTPIACSAYDLLEAAAVKRTSVMIRTTTGEKEVLVLDLFSKNKVEYMEGKDLRTSERFTVRLDELTITIPSQQTC